MVVQGVMINAEADLEPILHPVKGLGGLWVVVNRAVRTDQNQSMYVFAYTPIWLCLPYL